MDGFETLAGALESAVDWLTGPVGADIGTWLLAIVFALAAAPKLRRPALAALAMVDFRVTRRAHPALGAALGGAEAAVAVALASGVAPAVSLAAAALLLWAFVALIARALARGESFACWCFGETAEGLSRRTLARTAALAALATLLAAAGGEHLGTTLEGDAALAPVAAAAVVGCAALAARVGRLLRWNVYA